MNNPTDRDPGPPMSRWPARRARSRLDPASEAGSSPDIHKASLIISLLALTAIVLLATRPISLIFYHTTVFFGLPLAIVGLTGLILAYLARSGNLRGISLRPRSARQEDLAWVLGSFGALAAISWLFFRGQPLSQDELSMTFQANLFASGHLTAVFPLDSINRYVPLVLQNWFIIVDHSTGLAMSPYWPGWSLLMTPFAAIGAAWLAGPAFGAGAVVLIGRLAERMIGRDAVLPARLLTVASATFVLTSASSFANTGELCLNLAVVLLLLRGGRRNLLLGGLIGSLALNLHNPLPHMAFMLPWAIWFLLDAERRRNLGYLILGYLPGLILLFGWPLLLAHLITDRGSQTSPVSQIFALSLAGPMARFWDLANLWIWTVPGLLLMAALGFRSSHRRELRLLGWSFLVTVLAYLFYPYDQGHGFGPRYFFAAFGGLPILAAAYWVAQKGRERTRARVFALTGLVGVFVAVVIGISFVASFNSTPTMPAGDLEFLSSASGTVFPDSSGRPPIVVQSTNPVGDTAWAAAHFPGAQRLSLAPDGSSTWSLPVTP